MGFGYMLTRSQIIKGLLVKFGCLLCILYGVYSFFTTPTKAEDVEITLGDVTDTRTTGELFSGCEVEIKVMGDAVANSLGIRAVRVHSALDDTGQSLLKEDSEMPSFFDRSTQDKNTLREKITLKNPSRSAKSIKLLEGELELFQPTIENGGMVVIDNFMLEPSEPIESESLDRWNIQITYLTKESYEAKKKEFEETYKGNLERAREKIGGVFAEMFEDVFEENLSDEKNTLQFFIKDPKNRIVDLGFTDSLGNPIKAWSRSSIGELRIYSFKDQTPSSDTRLVVYLATPESIKVVPFKLENIPLP